MLPSKCRRGEECEESDPPYPPPLPRTLSPPALQPCYRWWEVPYYWAGLQVGAGATSSDWLRCPVPNALHAFLLNCTHTLLHKPISIVHNPALTRMLSHAHAGV